MTNNKFNPEFLMELSYENREAVINSLSMYQLNLCYNFYNNHLLALNHFINKRYNNFIYSKDKMTTEEFINSNNKIKKFEQIMDLINKQINIRNIDARFFC